MAPRNPIRRNHQNLVKFVMLRYKGRIIVRPLCHTSGTIRQVAAQDRSRSSLVQTMAAVSVKECPKVSDLIEKRIADGVSSISFEYFPPKTDDGRTNLISRIERMGKLK